MLNKLDEAIPLYEKVILLDSANVDAYVNLSLVYMKLKNYNKAIYLNKKAIKISPKFIMGYFYLSSIYFELNRLDEAILIAEKGYTINFSDKGLCKNLIHFYKVKGNMTKVLFYEKEYLKLQKQ